MADLDPLGLFSKKKEAPKPDPLKLFEQPSGVGEARKPDLGPEPADKQRLGPRRELAPKEDIMLDVPDAAGGDPLDLFAAPETAMSLASSAVLWPVSKVFGTAALIGGGTDGRTATQEAEYMENAVIDLAYKPYTKAGKNIMQGVSNVMDIVLFPAHKVGQTFEELTPHIDNPYVRDAVERLGWLSEFGMEALTFKILGDLPGKARQNAANVKLAREMGIPTSEIIRNVVKQPRAKFGLDLAVERAARAASDIASAKILEDVGESVDLITEARDIHQKYADVDEYAQRQVGLARRGGEPGTMQDVAEVQAYHRKVIAEKQIVIDVLNDPNKTTTQSIALLKKWRKTHEILIDRYIDDIGSEARLKKTHGTMEHNQRWIENYNKAIRQLQARPSPMQLIKISETPHEAQGGRQVIRQKYEFVKGDGRFGEATVDIVGERANVEWMDTSEGGILSTKDSLRLMKEFAKQNPTVDRAIGMHVREGKPSRPMDVDLKRARRPATQADPASRKIRRARNHGLEAKDLVAERRADIGEHMLDSEIFIQSLERRHSPAKLQAIPFLIEKMADPGELTAMVQKGIISAETANIIANPTPEVMADVKLVREYYADGHAFLKDHWSDVGWREDYVTHIWDLPWRKGQAKVMGEWFGTKNPFIKKSTNPTMLEGIKKGLVPKTTNIADLLRVYDSYKIKTAFNNKFAKGLTEMRDEAGDKMIRRRKELPENWQDEGWVYVDHPTINRSVWYQKVKVKGTEVPMLRTEGVYVHPDIAPMVKNIFGERWNNTVLNAIEAGNAITKKTMLSLSLFHHLALTEAALGSGIGIKALKLWSPKKVKAALIKGEYPALMEMLPLAKDSLRHGLTVDPLPDYHVGRINKLLESIEFRSRDIPVAGKVTKGIRVANKYWDAALWQYLHTTYKLMAYEKGVGDYMSKWLKEGRQYTPEMVKGMKQQVAGFVNDSFGGQNWEMMEVFGEPKMQQLLQLTFLAPDWTFSTIKQGAGLLSPKEFRGPLARKFWARSTAYFMAITQGLNYYNSQRMYGEGRLTFQNPEGKKLDVLMGRNPDGTERYMRIGKQFREVPEWVMEPMQKFGGKLAPVTRELMRQVTQHDPGSGFPAEFAEKEGVSKVASRLASVAKMAIPFPLRPYLQDRPGMWMFSIPTSKGMTKYRAVELFKKHIENDDRMGVERVYVQALQNKLPAGKMLKVAEHAVKRSINYEDKQVAKQMLNEFKRLKSQKERDALVKHYRATGLLTSNILRELKKILKEQRGIKIQTLKSGIKIYK